MLVSFCAGPKLHCQRGELCGSLGNKIQRRVGRAKKRRIRTVASHQVAFLWVEHRWPGCRLVSNHLPLPLNCCFPKGPWVKWGHITWVIVLYFPNTIVSMAGTGELLRQALAQELLARVVERSLGEPVRAAFCQNKRTL